MSVKQADGDFRHVLLLVPRLDLNNSRSMQCFLSGAQCRQIKTVANEKTELEAFLPPDIHRKYVAYVTNDCANVLCLLFNNLDND
jgi:hypothetical protein